MQEKLFGRHSPVLAPLCMDLAQTCEKLDDQERRRVLSREGPGHLDQGIRAGRRQRRVVHDDIGGVPGARGARGGRPEAAYWAHERERLRASGVCAIT